MDGYVDGVRGLAPVSMPCSLPRALSATNRESGQQEELDDKRRPDPHLEAQDADLSHGAAEGRVVFSVDNSVHLPARSTKARKALSQDISRPPLSLKKMSIQENVQLPHSGNCLADSPRASGRICLMGSASLPQGGRPIRRKLPRRRPSASPAHSGYWPRSPRQTRIPSHSLPKARDNFCYHFVV